MPKPDWSKLKADDPPPLPGVPMRIVSYAALLVLVGGLGGASFVWHDFLMPRNDSFTQRERVDANQREAVRRPSVVGRDFSIGALVWTAPVVVGILTYELAKDKRKWRPPEL